MDDSQVYVEPACEECDRTSCVAYIETNGGVLLCGPCYRQTLADVKRLEEGGHLLKGLWVTPKNLSRPSPIKRTVIEPTPGGLPDDEEGD